MNSVLFEIGKIRTYTKMNYVKYGRTISILNEMLQPKLKIKQETKLLLFEKGTCHKQKCEIVQKY